MELYEPINTPKPVGEDLWLVDRPLLRMSFAGISEPFPTRMVVVRSSQNAVPRRWANEPRRGEG